MPNPISDTEPLWECEVGCGAEFDDRDECEIHEQDCVHEEGE